MSNLFTKKVLDENNRFGLFSKSSALKGEVLYVSPALLMPISRFLNTELEKHLLFASDPAVALLPIGLSGIMRQVETNYNLEICWHHFKIDTGTAVSSRDLCLNMPDILDGGKKSKNDATKAPFVELFLEYRANKNIAIGEELTVSSNLGKQHIIPTSSLVTDEAYPSSPLVSFSSLFINSPFTDSHRADMLQFLMSLSQEDIVNTVIDKAHSNLPFNHHNIEL